MYEGDSFLTLSMVGRAGLVTLSAILALGLAWVLARLGQGRPRGLRALMALGAFWLFLWLSPQIYYFYYMILIDGLPLQNVIKRPPALTEMVSLMTFTDDANLSNHGKGILGWGLIALGVWGGRK